MMSVSNACVVASCELRLNLLKRRKRKLSHLASLITPIHTALCTMSRGMFTLKGPAKCLIALSLPDGLDRFLENVAQHSLFLVFPRASMAEWRETAREHIPA